MRVNSGSETGRMRVDFGGEIDPMPVRVASERTERLAERSKRLADRLKSPLGVVDLLLNVVDQKAPE